MSLRSRYTTLDHTSEEVASTLSDQAWLRIVSTVTKTGEKRWVRNPDGGYAEASPRQFSRVLARCATAEPVRFLRIASRFAPEALACYVDAVLSGVEAATAEARGEVLSNRVSVLRLVALLERAIDDGGEECAQTACDVIAKFSGLRWPDKVREWLGMTAAAGGPDRTITTVQSDESRVKDLDTSSFNSPDGRAGRAIGALLANQPEFLEEFLPAVTAMARSDRLEARLASLAASAAVAHIDEEQGGQLLKCAIEDGNEMILTGSLGQFAMRTFRATCGEQFGDAVRVLSQSVNPEARKASAAWAAVDFVLAGRLCDLLEGAMTGDAPERRGVAVGLLGLWSNSNHQNAVEPLLLRLLGDGDDSVVGEVSAVFRQRDAFHQLPSIKRLAGAFVRSKAFSKHYSNLLTGLSASDAPLLPFADVVFLATKRLSAEIAPATRDLGRHDALAGRTLSELLVRLLGETEGSGPIADACLDAWDQMLEQRVGMASDQLEELDADR